MQERGARREHRVVDGRELVDAAADNPPEVVAEEDFVLQVSAAFVAVVARAGASEMSKVLWRKLPP